ncbi:MAG: DUF4491 family protein [Spirochaetaceae bacterium]|nr:DUF4491 family protein [Spirochaetaceae bacterium]
MNWTGVIIGVISFLTIGIFHPIVIKGEYHFSAKIWPFFLVAGIAFCAISVFIDNTIASSALAVVGFSCLWSIGELKEQEERVRKGWFPANPKKKNGDDKLK